MTTVQAIGALILRVIGLYYVIVGLPVVGISAAIYFGWVEGNDKPAEVLPGLLYESGLVVLALLLVFLARPLGRLVAPSVPKADPSSRVSPGELVSIGSFILGILVLLYKLPGTLMWLAQIALAQMRDLDKTGFGFTPPFYNAWSAAETAVLILIGLWLVLRPGHLASLYRWLRTAGQVPPPPPEDESKPD